MMTAEDLRVEHKLAEIDEELEQSARQLKYMEAQVREIYQELLLAENRPGVIDFLQREVGDLRDEEVWSQAWQQR